jgi:hypothetical protein
MCTLEEIQKSLKLPEVIADFAWMEPTSLSCRATFVVDGQEVANLRWSCNDGDVPCRPVTGLDLGIVFESTGSSSPYRLLCSEELPISCCGLVL